MTEIKNGAKDLAAIKENLNKKAKIATGGIVSIAGDTLRIDKKTTWAELTGTIELVKSGNNLDLVYTSTSSWTGTALLIACVLFLFSIVGPVLPWYLKNQDASKFDDSIKQLLAVVSNV